MKLGHIATLSAALLGLGILAGCSTEATTPTEAPAANPTAPAIAPEAAPTAPTAPGATTTAPTTTEPTTAEPKSEIKDGSPTEYGTKDSTKMDGKTAPVAPDATAPVVPDATAPEAAPAGSSSSN